MDIVWTAFITAVHHLIIYNASLNKKLVINEANTVSLGWTMTACAYSGACCSCACVVVIHLPFCDNTQPPITLACNKLKIYIL